MNPSPSVSKKVLWTSYVLSALPALLVLFGAVVKIVHPPSLDEGFAHLGWPVGKVFGLGLLELACAVVYLVPRTAVLGAILLTGLMGGAIATVVRLDEAYFPQIIVGGLVWGGLYLRLPTLRNLIPLRR